MPPLPRRRLFLAAAPLLLSAGLALAQSDAPGAPLLLRPGDRLAIIGDSITEQKQYSKFIETYLRACAPQWQAQVIQLGWSGERAGGFASRMENDLMGWRPTLATLCYGMNDGSYCPYQPAIGLAYSNAMEAIATRFAAAGMRAVVGTPGVVDRDAWRREDPSADRYYNTNLFTLGTIGRAVAASHGFAFADVHDVMMNTMTNAKAALGADYHVAGSDGVHPAANGQLCMAYAFLKALRLDGCIGRLTWTWPAQAAASEGHAVKACADGALEVESSRYPFCFSGAPGDPNGTVSVLPYLPFNEELNRFTLVVRGFPAARAEIHWGNGRLSVTREQLEQGVNLSAILDNPFTGPFAAVTAAVGAKQARETQLIKGLLTNVRNASELAGGDAEFLQALLRLREGILARLDRAQAETQAAVKPVTHTIRLVPLE